MIILLYNYVNKERKKHMSMLSRVLLNVSVFAMLRVLANAAGTYYTGNYQSPQTRNAQRSYSPQRANNANYSQQ